MKINPHSKITLNFSLSLPDGSVIDSNFDQQPVELVLGAGDMLAGFEKALLGLQAGDELDTLITSEEAFGQYNDANIQRFKRSIFASGFELSEGLVVSFADSAGAELPGVVLSFDEEYVEVDFNHPLAGKDVAFRARIQAVIE